MFYGAYADCGKGMQCVVAIFHILYGDELVEKLRQDFLDIVSFFVFRSIPDCVVISLRTVHYCSGYVSQPGNNQFQRSLGVAGQPDTAIVIVVLLYIPALAVATVSVIKNGNCRAVYPQRA